MDSSSNLPTHELALRMIAMDYRFAETITYDPRRESYTFTVEDYLGSKLPNGEKIEFWAVGDQSLREALIVAYRGQVIGFFERRGDIAMTNYALSLFSS